MELALDYPFKKKRKKLLSLSWVRRAIKFVGYSLHTAFIVCRLYARLILRKTHCYQPLYNFTLLRNKNPQRTCLDRADAVYQKIHSWGPRGKILDIGCNWGFFSFYLADRGHFVTGIDTVTNNIHICRYLQKINKLSTQFNRAMFSQSYLNEISSGQYDIVLLFNVIHHLIYQQGLANVKILLRDLLDKIPVLFVELAVKNEPVKHPWIATLPADELDVFSLCPDISIEKIGHFSHGMTHVRRPLYMISKNKRQLCGQLRSVVQQKFVSFSGNRYPGCRYYDCGDVFIKKYFVTHSETNEKRITREISNYSLLPENDFFPALLEHRREKDTIEIMLSKLPGTNLHDMMMRNESVSVLLIVQRVIAALDYLLQNGLYHNDIRLWNILYDQQNVYLIDLGHAEKVETESTNLALLWMIAQLHQFTDYRFKYPIVVAPDFRDIQLDPECAAIVDALQQAGSFKAFLGSYRVDKA